jgi:hypothetical protein
MGGRVGERAGAATQQETRGLVPQPNKERATDSPHRFGTGGRENCYFVNALFLTASAR